MKNLYVDAGANGCWVCNCPMFVFNARVGFVLVNCWVAISVSHRQLGTNEFTGSVAALGNLVQLKHL